jgi:predicted amidophosphoribosyltransferase
MYCVNCGSFLHSTNQAGLVCQACKQEREQHPRVEKEPIAICYCFRCGKPYHPHDTSIQHTSCLGVSGNQQLSFQKR